MAASFRRRNEDSASSQTINKLGLSWTSQIAWYAGAGPNEYDNTSPQRKFLSRWLPFSDLREVMEFKIVQFFFRTTFALPTTFNFALYMRQATDSHILALVDVESSTWAILGAICFLNLARIKLWQVWIVSARPR